MYVESVRMRPQPITKQFVTHIDYASLFIWLSETARIAEEASIIGHLQKPRHVSPSPVFGLVTTQEFGSALAVL